MGFLHTERSTAKWLTSAHWKVWAGFYKDRIQRVKQKPEDIKVFVKVIHNRLPVINRNSPKWPKMTTDKETQRTWTNPCTVALTCCGLSQHVSLMCVLVFSCGNTVSHIYLLHTARALAAPAGCASLLWPMSNMTTTPWSKQSILSLSSIICSSGWRWQYSHYLIVFIRARGTESRTLKYSSRDQGSVWVLLQFCE